MADKKISELTAVATLEDTDVVPLASGGETKKITGANLKASMTGVGGEVTQAELDAHLNDTADAHDASAISNVAAGSLAATDVQAALNELDSEKAASSHAHAGEEITSGTVADARIASTIARDAEVTAAVTAHEADATAVHGIANTALLLDTSTTLDEIAAPVADVSLNNHKITGLAAPTAATDAATKGYADALAAGLDVKASVRAATTANITLSGAQTIDGVSVIATNRVLVKNQSAGAENGIYVAAAGAWARSTDADVDGEVNAGMFTFVEEGTTLGDQGWVLITNNPITVGTTALVFTQFSGAGATPTGTAGGVLSGTYPNPGFALDMATQTELDAHISDATAAHAAAAVAFTPAGTIAATTVQAAIEEVANEAAGTSAEGIYNVMDPAYGAVGDGVTNDLAACQAAVAAANAAAGGTVYFPGGKTFLLQGTAYGQDMLSPTSDVRMVGGAGATLKTGLYGGPVQIAVGAVSNVEVSGLTFDHGNIADTIAVRFSGSTHCTVENCTLNGTGWIFTYISGAASHIQIRNNMTRKGYGVLTHDSATCTHITVQGNRFLGGSVGEGIEINTPTGASSDWLITGNRINGYTATGSVGGFGIAVAHANRVDIVGNYISNMVNAAIRFEDGCSDVNCVGNYIYNVQEHGIYLIYGNSHEMRNFNISGNFLKGVGKLGNSWDTTVTNAISVQAGGVGVCAGIQITDNYIADCGINGISSAGIYVQGDPGGANVLIANNTVFKQLGDNGTTTKGRGIYVDGCSAGYVLITENTVVPAVSTDRTLATTGVMNNLVVRQNMLIGGTVLHSATGTSHFRDNPGYLTETSGSTSVADGGTITHGLGQSGTSLTPAVVTVTPSIASEMASVTAKSSTTFTVAIRKQDGDTGTTQIVYWRASVYS